MKHNLWGGLSVLLFIFLLLPIAGVNAQTPPEFDNVTISLWPEYDKPDTLVMYRARLSPNTQLPARLTFRLPAYIKEMHAVAIATDGQLINVEPEAITMDPDDGSILLSFPTTSPNVQFEYYDPFILNKENQDRNLTFNFAAPGNIAVTNFEIQQPFGAESFVLTPAAINTTTGQDNLQYSNILQENVAGGDTIQVVATYQRNSDALSIQSLQNNGPNVNVAAELPATSSPDNNMSNYLGYILVGLGVLLLLGIGGYWLMKNKKQNKQVDTPARRPKQSRRKKRQQSKQKTRQQTGAAIATASSTGANGGFCYNCGTALRGSANFCHSCGAQKRAT